MNVHATLTAHAVLPVDASRLTSESMADAAQLATRQLIDQLTGPLADLAATMATVPADTSPLVLAGRVMADIAELREQLAQLVTVRFTGQ